MNFTCHSPPFIKLGRIFVKLGGMRKRELSDSCALAHCSSIRAIWNLPIPLPYAS